MSQESAGRIVMNMFSLSAALTAAGVFTAMPGAVLLFAFGVEVFVWIAAGLVWSAAAMFLLAMFTTFIFCVYGSLTGKIPPRRAPRKPLV